MSVPQYILSLYRVLPTTMRRISVLTFTTLIVCIFFFYLTYEKLREDGGRGASKVHSVIRQYNKNCRAIPKIIHQSWKTNDLPERFEKWSQGWKDNNPDWVHVLWTDASNREMVANHFPWFLRTFDELPKNILRADVSRYLYMYKFGGVYADLDVESLKPMSDLIKLSNRMLREEAFQKRTEANLSRELISGAPRNMIILDTLHQSDPEIPANPEAKSEVQPEAELLLPLMGSDYSYGHNIPNAWIASRPGHSFWMHCIALVEENLNKWKSKRDKFGMKDLSVEGMTGPVLLFNAWRSYTNNVPVAQRDPIYLLEPGVIFPFDWHRHSDVFSFCSAAWGSFDPAACKEHFQATGKPEQKAWTITYWSHSWGDQ